MRDTQFIWYLCLMLWLLQHSLLCASNRLCLKKKFKKNYSLEGSTVRGRAGDSTHCCAADASNRDEITMVRTQHAHKHTFQHRIGRVCAHALLPHRNHLRAWLYTLSVVALCCFFLGCWNGASRICKWICWFRSCDNDVYAAFSTYINSLFVMLWS